MTAVPAAVAVIAASIALATDLHARRIPNWLTLSALLVGLLANAFLAGTQGALLALAGAGLGFALLIPFYAIRAIGAGDVKLLAAVGALLGPQLLLSAAAAGALVGGVMSVVILARRGRLTLAAHQMFVMKAIPTPSGAKAPYAVAITAGVYFAAFQLLATSALGF